VHAAVHQHVDLDPDRPVTYLKTISGGLPRPNGPVSSPPVTVSLSTCSQGPPIVRPETAGGQHQLREAAESTAQQPRPQIMSKIVISSAIRSHDTRYTRSLSTCRPSPGQSLGLHGRLRGPRPSSALPSRLQLKLGRKLSFPEHGFGADPWPLSQHKRGLTPLSHPRRRQIRVHRKTPPILH
jgi:hypothetical protein